MKKLSKRLFWITAVVIAVYAVLNLVFLLFAKAVVISQIEKNLKVKAGLRNVTVSFPLSINFNQLVISDLLKADTLTVSPNLLGFLAGKIVLNELKIVHPEITLLRDSDGKFNLPQAEAKGKQPPFFLLSLKVKNGKFIFLDKKIEPQGYTVTMGDIDINVAKVALPLTSLRTNFIVSSSLLDTANNPVGSARAVGWIDFGPKDMEGKLELVDIEATRLLPYYKNIFSKKKLLSAKLNFNADLNAKNNDLLIKCHTEFSNIIYDTQGQSGPAQAVGDILPNILNIFSDTSGNISFDFTIATKLDKPRMDKVSIKGIIGQAVGENIAHQGPAQVIEKVKGMAEEFKGLGKSLKDIFKKKDKQD